MQRKNTKENCRSGVTLTLNVGQATPDRKKLLIQRQVSPDLQTANDWMFLPKHCQAKPALPEFQHGGFTLIELLVVVLIIGILAAVALPQYQNAVEKSRATQALTLLKSVSQAADAYYLANGTHVKTFDELAIDIPWQNSTEGIGSQKKSKANGYWAINIDNSGSILALRLSGKYQGAYFSANVGNPVGCAERKQGGTRIFKAKAGSFCEKIMKGTLIDDNAYNRVYSLP